MVSWGIWGISVYHVGQEVAVASFLLCLKFWGMTQGYGGFLLLGMAGAVPATLAVGQALEVVNIVLVSSRLSILTPGINQLSRVESLNDISKFQIIKVF